MQNSVNISNMTETGFSTLSYLCHEMWWKLKSLSKTISRIWTVFGGDVSIFSKQFNSWQSEIYFSNDTFLHHLYSV